jgi:aspartate kinase
MKVAKFGGTSMANAEQIKKVCNIVLSDSKRRLVVVSAPGKRFKEDTKVTDLLIACGMKYLQDGNSEKELMAVVDRYAEIATDLGINSEIAEVVKKDLVSRQIKCASDKNSNDPLYKEKFMDSMKAAGEDNSAKVIAEYLKSINQKARYINPKDAGLFLSDEFGNAQVLQESYENLKKLKDFDGITIFPGFFGYTKSGDVATFPRGGSDITGSILACAVNAEVYENFTDVDSVFSANPNVVKNPKAISCLTYREMRELSYAGFSVLHEETLAPVFHAGVPVNIKNTNNPSAPGTMISTKRDFDGGSVVGIACANGFSTIDLSKYLMNREIGFGRKLLQILEEEGLSYEHMPSGIDNISVVFKSSQLNEVEEEKVLSRIKNELNVDELCIYHDLSLVIIVGEGMRNSVGVATKATSAFSKAGINLEMINQGASEISMMFAVNLEDADKAVVALYDEFFN